MKKRNPAVIIAALLALLLAAGLVFFRERLKGSRALITPKTAGMPPVESKPMTVPTEAPRLAMRVDANKPKELRRFLESNAWLQDALASPLGRGFSSGWSAFLSSKGEDLRASFKGTIASYLLDQVLAQPFSVVWFGGETASGQPALVVESASRGQKGAVSALGEIAARGGYTATHCPGESAPTPKKDKDGKELPPEPKLHIARWLVADHAVYAGTHGDRIVFASKPTAVLQALCVAMKDHARSAHALDTAIFPEHLGREAQALAALVGVGEELRFALDIDGERLAPAGVSAKLAAADRLGVVAAGDDVLKLLPVDAPVVALLALNLPEKLDGESIGAHLKGEGKGQKRVRHVALVWTPHGLDAPTDIALVWGKTEDERALDEVFAGGNRLVKRKACAHVILASTAEAAARLEDACKGKRPSRQNAEPAVVAGAKAPSSLGLHVHTGALLSSLMLDAFRAEQAVKPKGALPVEIEQSKRKLEALPFFGFRGRVEGGALVGEGFRS